MEKYQDMVYRCPGPYSRAGGTYDTKGVNSRAEHDAALNDGWFNTMPEAIAGNASVVETPADDKPPTRAELEQKATELGIKFDKKTKDEDLAKKIAGALGA
ncbi:MAG: hypothetical protein RLZZ200_1108 [Pseudomonadota bacterium]|jgi:hypothetical protein